MTKYCKECVYHHNAHHGKKAPKHYLKNYNDWCCAVGCTARKAIGYCRLHELRQIKGENDD